MTPHRTLSLLTGAASYAGSSIDVQGERTVDGARDSNDLKGGAAFVYSTSPIIPYAFGNGDSIECPCTNEATGCGGCANSAGSGAVLSGSGSASVASDDLVLEVSAGVPNKLGLFLQGDDTLGDGLGIPFGDGLLAMTGSIVRIEVVLFDGNGDCNSTVSIAGTGAATPGDVKRYQLWYRDLQGPCGSGSNLTNGLQVNWQP